MASGSGWWIGSATSEPSTSTASANLTFSGQDLTGINTVRVQRGAINTTFGPIGGQQQADELRVGDTFADVAPIPEPSALAVGVLGGFGLMGLRTKG